MPEIVVVGAANMDIGATAASAPVMGDSNPGRVRVSAGGVGFNIARDLCLLGADTAMVTALGDDGFAESILAEAERLGLDMSGAERMPGQRTSSYVFIAGPEGDMALAVNDMDVCRAVTPEFLARRRGLIESARLLVLDANLPEESICWLCAHTDAPIVADPVSAAKAPRLRGVLRRLYALKPNRLEAEVLTGVPVSAEADAERAAEALLALGVRQAYISLSDRGLYAASAEGERLRLPCPPAEAVDTTGCGDAMTAAIAFSLLRGADLRETARRAMRAGAFTCTAPGAVHPQLCRAVLEQNG